MISDEIISVIGDIGNLYTRFGFSGDDFPRWNTFSKCTDKFAFGDEALEMRPTLDVMNPINFDLYEKLLKAAFDNLKVSPKDYSLLLANNFQNKQDLQKVVEIIFESLEIPNFFTMRNAALSTFSAGRSTALVLDIGAYTTTAVSVHDGYTLLKTQIQAGIGGESLNQSFIPLIPKQEGESTFKYDFIVRDAKHSLLSFECNESTINQYELPDGSFVKLSPIEIVNIADKLFQPNENGFKGVGHMLYEVVNNSHVDLKQILCNTVLATGGSSTINGFLNKLNNNLNNLTQMKSKLVQYPLQQNRYNSVFIGGSILGSLSSFQTMWVGRSEYQESGKFSLLERKCPM